MSRSGAGSGAVNGAAAGTSVYPGWGTAIGAGVGAIAGGLLGGGPDLDEIFGGIDIPTLEELIRSGQIDATAFDSIALDPSTRAAQMEVLGSLINEGRRGGASIESLATQAQMQDRANASERMNREAILQSMASRGQRGGGAELAAQLANQQGAAQRGALASAQMAGDDRMRVLRSMSEAGRLGGSIRGQDYGMASDRASARDSLARWNAQNRRSAYQDRMGWEFDRARGRAGLAGEQYARDTGLGGAIGSVAGGAYDYFRNRRDNDEEG